jgi:hypothetical protein
VSTEAPQAECREERAEPEVKGQLDPLKWPEAIVGLVGEVDVEVEGAEAGRGVAVGAG